MEDTMELIKSILKEHQEIFHNTQNTEKALNDIQAGAVMEKAREGFTPGRLGNQKQSLIDLQKSLETIEKGLREHFDREEKGLLNLFETKGYRAIATALKGLLTEHEELINRMNRAIKEVAELASTQVSREVWDGKAWGTRTYINNTLSLLKAHARNEEELFNQLGKELK